MGLGNGEYWQRFYMNQRRNAPKHSFEWLLDPGAAGTVTLTLHGAMEDQGMAPTTDPPDWTEDLLEVASVVASGGVQKIVQVVDDRNRVNGCNVFYAKFVIAGSTGDCDYSGGRVRNWTD